MVLSRLPSSGLRPSPSGPWRGLAFVAGVLAWLAAAAVAAILAVFFAATLLVIAVMASLLLALAGAAVKARRAGRQALPEVLEARRVGGHSWIAYGAERDL